MMTSLTPIMGLTLFVLISVVHTCGGHFFYAWKGITNHQVLGGKFVGGPETISACKAACVEMGNCMAIDWNKPGKRCYTFPSAGGTLRANKDVDRWIRVKATHYNLPRVYVFKKGSASFKVYGGVIYKSFPASNPKLYALDFNGKPGSYALASMFKKYGGSFTLGFYINARDISRNQILIAQWAPGRWQYILRLQKGGSLLLQLRRDKYNTGSDPRQDMLPGGCVGGKVTVNKWHYVAFSWDHKTGEAKIYLDGKVVATKKTKYPDHNLFHNPYPQFQLGYKMDTKNENFNGLIANVRFDTAVVVVKNFIRFYYHYKSTESTVCEHQPLKMTCASGTKIRIMSANYGRTDSKTCIAKIAANYYSKTNCNHQAKSLAVVKKFCDGKPACIVKADNSVFGDPCEGTFKFLRVRFQCRH